MKFSILFLSTVLAVVCTSSQAMNSMDFDEPSYPKYHQFGLELNSCLQKEIDLRNRSEKNYVSKIHENQEKPLNIFLRFANSLHECKIDAKEYLPIWGTLADTYLKLASQGFTTTQQSSDADTYFATELWEKIDHKETTYEWFSLYCDRLSILVTPPVDRRNANYPLNVGCCEYKLKLLNTNISFQNEKVGEPWLVDAFYRLACHSHGSKYTKDVHSPLALTRQFPDIVMLPFPFELTAKDIWTTLPTPNGNHLWPLGFVTSRIKADGVDFSPLRFYMHDQFHLSQYIHNLNKGDLFFGISPTKNGPKTRDVWDDVRQCKQIWFEIVEKLQEARLKHEDSNDDQWIMNDFFMFWCTHETVYTLVERLRFISQGAFYRLPLTPSGLIYDEDGPPNLFDENYYLPSLTESLKQKASPFEKRVNTCRSILDEVIDNLSSSTILPFENAKSLKEEVFGRLSEAKEERTQDSLETLMGDVAAQLKSLTELDSRVNPLDLYKAQILRDAQEFCDLFNEYQNKCKEWIYSVIAEQIQKIEYCIIPAWNHKLNESSEVTKGICWATLNSRGNQIYKEYGVECPCIASGNQFEKELSSTGYLEIIRYYSNNSVLNLDVDPDLSKQTWATMDWLKLTNTDSVNNEPEDLPMNAMDVAPQEAS